MRLLKALVLTAVPALYVAGAVPALATEASDLLLKVAENKKSEYQLCLALNKCRVRYTSCFAQLEKKFPPQKWSSEREKCVATYKVCIDKTFKSGELFFTRWFQRDVDCKQFR